MTRLRALAALACLACLAGLAACGQGEQPFAPPLLLDQAGLAGRVELVPEAASYGSPVQGLFTGQTSYTGLVVGIGGGSLLSLELDSGAGVSLALYGPRRPDGLFGAALAWTPRVTPGGATLSAPPLATAGDYLVLAADPDRAGLAYSLTVECLSGCEAPRCPALVCGRYCPNGLVSDADGCPTCACATGCTSDAGCPLDFVCQDGSCQRAQSTCDCAANPYAPVCGQDDRTYANACELACAGVALAQEGACTTPDCAADADCPAGMLCLAGVCQPTCDCSGLAYAPVCGRDGRTYPNGCELACAGVGLSHQGSCDTCNPEVCGDGQDNDCDGYADEGCAGPCAADADCPTGLVCQAGTCAAPTPCAAGLDCPAGQTCEAGVCRPATGCLVESCNGLDDDCDGLVDEGCPACRADADCAAGELCLDGWCEIPPGCSADADCPAGLVCVANLCARAPVDLDGDGYSPPEDCDDADAAVNPGAAEACDDGLDNDCDGLTDEDCPQTCASDADCAAGEVCVSGVCVIACRTDAECPAGQTCQGGVCSP